jgi:hypothetical protein
MNMNLSELINEILSEWAYRVDDGQPNPKNEKHLAQLSIVLSELGLSNIKDELFENITEADKNFKNAILNKEIPYKGADGTQKKGIVGNLLRLPKDSPGRVAAEKLMPPEGSEERDSAMQDLGSEKDGKSTGGDKEKGKEDEKGKEGGEEKGGGEEEKAKAAQAMFDPKADPAMGARLDREKAANAKLAQKDKEKNDAEKATSDETPEGQYPPISEPPPQNEKGEVDSDGKIAGTEIEAEGGLDDVPKSFLQKISTKMGDFYNHFKQDRLQAEEKAMKVFGYTQQDVNRLSKDKDSAEFKAYDDEVKKNQEPTFNLCSISIPGTNLFCDGNKGITRDKMPQFKGKPEEGSQAWNELEAGKKSGKYKETDTEVEGEPFFRQLLADKDIKVTNAQIAADSLKATQSELVGDKVMGMKSVLDKGPDHPAFKKITAPIFVSKDGYVVDGHHRWAAITAHNIENPDNPLPMNVMIIDKDIDEAIDISNEFASNFGVAAKSGKQTGPQSGENPEPPKDEPSRPDTTPPTGDETDTKTIKGKTSGKEIKTIEFDGGGQVYGTQHTNTEMVDDIIDDIKSKIPKEKWKDIVFVGEGGATNKETGELEFNDEMDYAVPKFKEMGAGVDTFDGDDLDVHKPESKLYKKQIEKTGLNQSQVNAGNWASMIGQGEGTDTMKPTKFLGEDGKQFLQDAAKEAGLPQIENFDNPTGEAPSEDNDWKGTGDRGTLYRLSFPDDNGDKPTKINDIQVAFNEIRDENIIEKNKELTAQGKIPITIAGEGHIDLLSKKKKEQDTVEKPEEKLPEPKAANETPGGVIYSIGGGYYSDTPDGPAQYVTTESIVEKVLIEGDESLAYLLFEAVVNKVTAKGKKVRVQTIDPKKQKKATAKAKEASTEEPVDGEFEQPIDGEQPQEKYPYENMDPKELERIQNELYPKTKNGELVLLSENPSAQNAFNKGYVQGSWWVAPGNAGSCFNENGSNEGVKILEKYSDMSEDDLARIMHNKFCPTKLGSEQKKVAGKTRIVVPPDIKNKECYQSCVIAARSARTKFNRQQEAVAKAQEKGFGKTSKIYTFGGTQTKVGKTNSELDTTPNGVKGDKQNMIDIATAVPDNGKCFIYDRGTGITFEVPRQKLVDWIAAGGGGENAADTVVMSVDENGNIVYSGWSDKKTLKDIQGNSTLNYDFVQNKNRLNEMLSSGLIDEKTHKKAIAILDENLKAITEIESKYKTVSAVNAKHFSEITPNEMNQLGKELSKNPDTAKYYKYNEDNINKIKNLEDKNAASYTDDFSMLAMESMLGEKRKKSRNEVLAEKQLNTITSKYPEYETVAKLKVALKDKKISASTDEEKAQAAADLKTLNDSEKVIKQSRTEYVSSFINWKNTKKGQAKLKSVSSFRVLCNIASDKNNTSLLSDDQRKIIERAASYERYKYKLAEVSSKKVKDKSDLTKIASLEKSLGISAKQLDKRYKGKVPKSLDTGKLLGQLRKKSLDTQTETYRQLNTLVGKSKNGKDKKIGDLLAFRDANDLYHLDKINSPENENDTHQILKRSTSLTMEGLDVDASTIKSCMDVEDTRELEDLFELEFGSDEYSYNEDGEVSGKTVIIYALTKDGVKKQVGRKVYRGKDGPTSPTSTTIDWSDDMQKCFESKGTYDRKTK